MMRVRPVVLVLAVASLAGSLRPVSAFAQAAVTPQTPSVGGEVFRVDNVTGALSPLESAGVRKEGSGKVSCYLEGAHSPITLRSTESLVFAVRQDGSARDMEVFRKMSRGLYQLEALFINDKDRRYATKKFVPMDGAPFGEFISGVDPKRSKDVGQAFWFKPKTALPPGEYALSLGGLLMGTYPSPGCMKVVSAFRVIE